MKNNLRSLLISLKITLPMPKLNNLEIAGSKNGQLGFEEKLVAIDKMTNDYWIQKCIYCTKYFSKIRLVSLMKGVFQKAEIIRKPFNPVGAAPYSSSVTSAWSSSSNLMGAGRVIAVTSSPAMSPHPPAPHPTPLVCAGRVWYPL
jgi:hypothetical protein